jgi:hypothetical protein
MRKRSVSVAQLAEDNFTKNIVFIYFIHFIQVKYPVSINWRVISSRLGNVFGFDRF